MQHKGHTNEITVYVVDDDQAVRATLSNILQVNNYAVCTFADPLDLLRYPLKTENCCLILDLAMPNMSGLELQRELLNKGVMMPIIIYSGRACIDSAVTAMSGGAFTVLQKPTNNKTILATIQRAIEDFIKKRDDNVKNKMAYKAIMTLSKREQEIARLISEGQTSVSIAKQLFISSRTVETHRAAIFQKLNIKSAGPLAHLILRHDLYNNYQLKEIPFN